MKYFVSFGLLAALAALLLIKTDATQEKVATDIHGDFACEIPLLSFEEADFDRVIDGEVFSQTLVISGPEWNNTLIKNCRVHDTEGDGIVVRDVSNVIITDCSFENIGGQAAVRGSITGGTDGVVLYKNRVKHTAENGFNFGQRSAQAIDHTNLKIIGNTIDDTGREEGSGLAHGMYIQAQDFEITHNTITGSRDGNGISVRSSGLISCNTIAGKSASNKPGIRYYSDHQRGESNSLIIERNTITGSRVGIDLFSPVKRYDGFGGYDHVVTNFTISNNTIQDSTTPVSVAVEYTRDPFVVTK